MLHLFRLIQFSKKVKRRFFCTEKGIFCTEKRILLHREKGEKKTTGHFCKNDGLFYQKRRVTFIKTTGRFFRTSGGAFSTISRWGVFNYFQVGCFNHFQVFFYQFFSKEHSRNKTKKNLGHWETSERFLIVMNRGGKKWKSVAPKKKINAPKRKKMFSKERLQQHSVCPQQHRRGKLVRARFWND